MSSLVRLRRIVVATVLAAFASACASEPEPRVGPAAAATAPAPAQASALTETTPGPSPAPAGQPPTADPNPIAPPTPLPVAPNPAGLPFTVDDNFIMSQLLAAGAPGGAVAIVKGDNIVWSKGYGYADIQANRPATADTLFMLASISKTVTGVALMQLLERSNLGIAALDVDVNSIGLPFVVRNPYWPQQPITFRMLMTHTSSLEDTNLDHYNACAGDCGGGLASFLGAYVQDPNNWSDTPPGTNHSYSNTGMALAGYLVERLSNTNLQQVSYANIFAPLGMTETSWFMTGLTPSRVAMPYDWDGAYFYPQGYYGFPDYPSGQLRTSVNQLARFMMAVSGDGSLSGVRLLQPATMNEMKRQQLLPYSEEQSLPFWNTARSGRRLVGHDGAYWGVSTDMWFDPLTRAGYILLTNGSAYMSENQSQLDAMEALNQRLFDMALAVP